MGISEGDTFRLFVAGQYMTVTYNGSDLVLTPGHHLNGDIFHISEKGNFLPGLQVRDETYYDPDREDSGDEEQEQETAIGTLVPDANFPLDIFYFSRESQYLAANGTWVTDTTTALKFELNNLERWSADDFPPTIMSKITDPIIDPANPTSADGIDLYHPDAWFSIYFLENDARSAGNVAEQGGSDGPPRICFTSAPYGKGTSFHLVLREGQSLLQDQFGRFLGAERFENRYANPPDECDQHTALSKCRHCYYLYDIGFVFKPTHPATIVRKGPPTMFVLYDGAYYYRFEGIKAAYACLGRVEKIEEATPLQFVGA